MTPFLELLAAVEAHLRLGMCCLSQSLPDALAAVRCAPESREQCPPRIERPVRAGVGDIRPLLLEAVGLELQGLDEEAGHDRLSGPRVVGEEEA